MAAYTYTRKHHITGWDPEDREAWDNGGAGIARRNLIWSIICEPAAKPISTDGRNPQCGQMGEASRFCSVRAKQLFSPARRFW